MVEQLKKKICFFFTGKGGGIIQNTASEAMAAIMIAARVNKQGKLMRQRLQLPVDARLTDEQQEETFYADSSKLVVYVGDQSHFSAFKAIRCAGTSNVFFLFFELIK